MSLRTTVAAVVIVLSGVAYADAAVLCANESGSVFVRDSCRSNETVLDPVALGLVGPQGPQGSEGPQGPAASHLWARVVTFFGGAIFSNTGTGVASYSGSIGRYTISFPEPVATCATVVTPNWGINNGFASVQRHIAIVAGTNTDTSVNVSFLDSTTGAFVEPLGFNIAVTC